MAGGPQVAEAVQRRARDGGEQLLECRQADRAPVRVERLGDGFLEQRVEWPGRPAAGPGLVGTVHPGVQRPRRDVQGLGYRRPGPAQRHLRGRAAHGLLCLAPRQLGIAQRPLELLVAVDDPRQFLCAGTPACRLGLIFLGTGIIISGDRRCMLAGHGGWAVFWEGIFVRWSRHGRRLARGGALACRGGVIFFGRGRFADGA